MYSSCISFYNTLKLLKSLFIQQSGTFESLQLFSYFIYKELVCREVGGKIFLVQLGSSHGSDSLWFECLSVNKHISGYTALWHSKFEQRGSLIVLPHERDFLILFLNNIWVTSDHYLCHHTPAWIHNWGLDIFSMAGKYLSSVLRYNFVVLYSSISTSCYFSLNPSYVGLKCERENDYIINGS